MAIFDFHLLKLEYALVFQILGQELFDTAFETFIASNG